MKAYESHEKARRSQIQRANFQILENLYKIQNRSTINNQRLGGRKPIYLLDTSVDTMKRQPEKEDSWYNSRPTGK
jgi:hypothetical protein